MPTKYRNVLAKKKEKKTPKIDPFFNVCTSCYIHIPVWYIICTVVQVQPIHVIKVSKNLFAKKEEKYTTKKGSQTQLPNNILVFISFYFLMAIPEKCDVPAFSLHYI